MSSLRPGNQALWQRRIPTPVLAGAIVAWLSSLAAAECVFVAHLAPDGTKEVVVVDSASVQTIATLPAADIVADMATSPDGRTVVATSVRYDSDQCPFDGQLTVIDATTGSVTATINVAASVDSVTFGADGLAYVVDNLSSMVDVVDVAAGIVLASLPIQDGGGWCPQTIDAEGPQPSAMAPSADGRTIYVAALQCGFVCQGHISAIDTSSRSVRVVASFAPEGLAVGSNGRLFAATGLLDTIDPVTGAQTSTMTPSFDVAADASNVYVTDYQGVSIVNPSTGEVVKRFAITGSADRLVLHGDRLYAPPTEGVNIIDLTTQTVRLVPISRPEALAIAACQVTSATTSPTSTPTATATPPAPSTITATSTSIPGVAIRPHDDSGCNLTPSSSGDRIVLLLVPLLLFRRRRRRLSQVSCASNVHTGHTADMSSVTGLGLKCDGGCCTG